MPTGKKVFKWQSCRRKEDERERGGRLYVKAAETLPQKIGEDPAEAGKTGLGTTPSSSRKRSFHHTEGGGVSLSVVPKNLSSGGRNRWAGASPFEGVQGGVYFLLEKRGALIHAKKKDASLQETEGDPGKVCEGRVLGVAWRSGDSSSVAGGKRERLVLGGCLRGGGEGMRVSH